MQQLDVVSADGTRLTAAHVGSGVPIVFVNGSFAGLDSWQPVTDLLVDEFTCWSYARRGYPPSDVPDGPNTYAADAADLAAVVAAAGGRAHVVGGSHGATVALHAALAYPDIAGSLTVFEAPLYSAGDALAPTLERVRALHAAGRQADAVGILLAEVARMPAELLSGMDGGDAPPAALVRGALGDLEAAVADTTDLQRWRALRMPVQVLQGEMTWSPMPQTMDALHAELPEGSEQVVFPGQSHFTTHSAPDVFAAAVRTFVRRHA